MTEHPVKCPFCEKIRMELFVHKPTIMPRIYCEQCLERMRKDDDEI